MLNKPIPEPEKSAPSQPTSPYSFSAFQAEISQVEEKLNQSQSFSDEEIESIVQQTDQIIHDLEKNQAKSTESSQPEIEQAEIQTIQNKTIDIKIELIKKIPDKHLEKAKQIAYETVVQYAKQQNLTNYHYDQNELEQLTSSQAVAQHARQVINQIRQQQQDLQTLNSFSRRTSEERQ